MAQILDKLVPLLIIRHMKTTSGTPLKTEDAENAWLIRLGASLRQARLALGVTATAAAQAAGVSRPTWHRMEAGAPGVSAGAYARALESLGLASLTASDVEDSAAGTRPEGTIPTRIRIGDWPQLAAVAWSLQPDTLVTPRQALEIYERNRRHLDRAELSEDEAGLIRDLRDALADDVQP